MVAEDIVITTTFLDRLSKPIKEVTKTIQDLGNGAQKATTTFRNLTGKQKGVTRSINQTTKGMKRFKMELLSVMFFGMAISKFFSGLLQPAMQLAGIFDIWGAILQVLFLPVALALLDPLLDLMDIFMGLDPTIQLLIGGFVLLGAVVGQAMFLFGMIGLGLSGVSQAASGLRVLFLGGLGLVALLALIWVFRDDIKELWATISQGEQFQALKQNVSDMGEAIKNKDWPSLWASFKSATMNALGVVKEFAKGIWDKISTKFKEFNWGALWSTTFFSITNALEVIQKFISNVGQKIFDFLAAIDWDKVWEKLFAFTGQIGFLVGKFIGEIVQTILDWFTFDNVMTLVKTILGLIVAVIGGVWNFIMGAITGAGQGMSSSSLNSEATGGFIPHTGLYKLHAGETVSQAGDTLNSSPTINVYGSSNDDLVSQISAAVVRDLGSLSRR